MVDLQKGSMLKRISAWIFDTIMLVVLITGIAFLMSYLFKLDAHQAAVDEAYTKYETEYGVSFDIGTGYYDLAPEEKVNYDEAYKALVNDDEAMYSYNMVINLTLLIASLSILAGYLVMEFAIPMIIGNGRTLGKLIFGLGVCTVDAIRITGPILFIRTVLGKYTIETMVPALICISMYFGTASFVSLIVLALIVLLEVILVITSKTNSPIHDVLAKTVVIDYASQRIFDNADELIGYKKKVAADKASEKKYF